MRFQTEFDWVLKIREAQGLPSAPREGETYLFEKTIERVYPLHLPILLVDDDHNVYGRCVITEYTAGGGHTRGRYRIIALFGDDKRRLFTEDLLETVRWTAQQSRA